MRFPEGAFIYVNGDVNEGCFSRTLRRGISLDVPNNRPAVCSEIEYSQIKTYRISGSNITEPTAPLWRMIRKGNSDYALILCLHELVNWGWALCYFLYSTNKYYVLCAQTHEKPMMNWRSFHVCTYVLASSAWLEVVRIWGGEWHSSHSQSKCSVFLFWSKLHILHSSRQSYVIFLWSWGSCVRFLIVVILQVWLTCQVFSK